MRAGTGDLFKEHREEHQTQKKMGLSKDEGEKRPYPCLSFSQLPGEYKGGGTMTQWIGIFFSFFISLTYK